MYGRALACGALALLMVMVTHVSWIVHRTETETLKKELEALKRRMHDAEMMLSKKAVGEHGYLRSFTSNLSMDGV